MTVGKPKLKWKRSGDGCRRWSNGTWSAVVRLGFHVVVGLKGKPVFYESPIESLAEGMRIAERFLSEVKVSLNATEGI